MTDTLHPNLTQLIEVRERLAIVEKSTKTLEDTLPRIGKLEAEIAAQERQLRRISKVFSRGRQAGKATPAAISQALPAGSALQSFILEFILTWCCTNVRPSVSIR